MSRSPFSQTRRDGTKRRRRDAARLDLYRRAVFAKVKSRNDEGSEYSDPLADQVAGRIRKLVASAHCSCEILQEMVSIMETHSDTVVFDHDRRLLAPLVLPSIQELFFYYRLFDDLESQLSSLCPTAIPLLEDERKYLRMVIESLDQEYFCSKLLRSMDWGDTSTDWGDRTGPKEVQRLLSRFPSESVLERAIQCVCLSARYTATTSTSEPFDDESFIEQIVDICRSRFGRVIFNALENRRGRAHLPTVLFIARSPKTGQLLVGANRIQLDGDWALELDLSHFESRRASLSRHQTQYGALEKRFVSIFKRKSRNDGVITLSSEDLERAIKASSYAQPITEGVYGASYLLFKDKTKEILTYFPPFGTCKLLFGFSDRKDISKESLGDLPESTLKASSDQPPAETVDNLSQDISYNAITASTLFYGFLRCAESAWYIKLEHEYKSRKSKCSKKKRGEKKGKKSRKAKRRQLKMRQRT